MLFETIYLEWPRDRERGREGGKERERGRERKGERERERERRERGREGGGECRIIIKCPIIPLHGFLHTFHDIIVLMAGP